MWANRRILVCMEYDMPTKDELEQENDELISENENLQSQVAELKAKLEQAESRAEGGEQATYSVNSLRARRQRQADEAEAAAKAASGDTTANDDTDRNADRSSNTRTMGAVELREPTHEPFAPSVAEEGVVSDPPSTSTSVAKAATTGKNADGDNG